VNAEPLLVELPGGGRVLFSERAHGNASSVGGEGAEEGVAVRERLRELAGLRALARGYQVHGTVVQRVRVPPPPEPAPAEAALAVALGATVCDDDGDDTVTSRVQAPAAPRPAAPLRPAERREPADGQATALRLIGATVLTADCLAIALGGEGAVAVVHAGWRGLASGVIEEGVRAARELGALAPTHAVIGPGAGVCCYEVGPEVHAAFEGAHARGRNIDLRAIARERLLAAGVREVSDVDLCTICDERFFSHRREGERAGRQAAIAWRT
jgi:YfiH family protein